MATPEDARRANRSLLLTELHRDGPLSRAELAKRTGLTRATASAVVRDLMEMDIVVELGPDPAGGVGKPATLVGIDPDGRHVVSLDLSDPDQMVGAIVNLAGDVVTRRAVARGAKTGKAALTLAARICTDLVAAADRPLLGIGVASPGVVDGDGVVVTAAHLRWTDVDLAGELARRLSLPIAVLNNADAGALAELTFGEGETDNVLCVRVDEGVGAGLVLDGRLFRGSHHASGEIGHVVVDPQGDSCACGKSGCLETEVAVPVVRQRLDAAISDRAADAVVRVAGDHLGAVLAIVVSALDVADVVLSAPAPVGTDAFRAALGDAIATRVAGGLGDRLTVRASSLGLNDALVGAAARVLDTRLGLT